jgi:hypothetical protein
MNCPHCGKEIIDLHDIMRKVRDFGNLEERIGVMQREVAKQVELSYRGEAYDKSINELIETKQKRDTMVCDIERMITKFGYHREAPAKNYPPEIPPRKRNWGERLIKMMGGVK